MAYKSPKNWKDLVEPCKHRHGLSRRELLFRGISTGVLSLSASKLFMGDLVQQAVAAELNCPPPMLIKGAVAQILSEGGPTMGARFISQAQASGISKQNAMANNYGIYGEKLVPIGPATAQKRIYVDSESPFGFTLLQGPPGYPGGATEWQKNVLSKVSGGGHLGPFNQDDGAGINTGLVGGFSPFKSSKIGKDLKVGNSVTLATWANGLPGATVARNNLQPSSFASVFSLTPAANGLTNQNALKVSSDAANSIAKALAPVFGTDRRKGAQNLADSAGCAFYNNSELADPTYGAKLFDPASTLNRALAKNVTLAQLTNPEKATLAAYYQSAMGMSGGVITQFGGRDYHGQDVGNVITPADVEEARSFVMFLAACEAANAPGAIIYVSNGQAIASGTLPVQATINGVASTVRGPAARGDAGGAYNAGLILYYDPAGNPPEGRFTGALSGDGSVKTDPGVANSREAMAGLYLSALTFVDPKKSVPTKALSAMQAAGVAKSPDSIMLIKG